MNPNTNENTLSPKETVLNAPTVLTDKVKEFKLIARNALRMELINPILAEINRLEKEEKAIDEVVAAKTKKIDIAKYKIDRLKRLDADHPDFNNLTKEQIGVIELTRKNIDDLVKEKETYTQRITEEKTAIAKIETGETLVSAERLEEMVDKLILQDAKNTIIA